MLLQKTDKARAELQPGARTLSLRERSLLLMADGRKSVLDMRAVLGDDVEPMVRQLVDAGFLEQVVVPPKPVEVAPSASARLAAAGNAGQGADAFEGKRSLATTRMFLFDICERMFARRDPALAERLREALRNAKDRDAMLAESRTMLDEIEKVAGFERADSIAERIAMLLPPETAGVSG